MPNRDAEREPLTDERIETALHTFAPASPPADSAFEARLRGRFLSAIDEQLAEGATVVQGPERASRSLRWLVWPVAVMGLALAFLVAAPLLRPEPAQQAAAPEAVERAQIVSANAAAWDSVTDVFGVYRDENGRDYQEWVVFREDGPPRYRRLLIGEGEMPGVRDQWNISDGDSAWIVDGATGEVLESARDDEDLSIPTVLQCGSLVLPADADNGPSPSPGVLDGRSVYRLEAEVDGEMIVYWVDAADFLVYRVDDATGRTVWQRGAIATNEGMDPSIFDPSNLNRHEG